MQQTGCGCATFAGRQPRGKVLDFEPPRSPDPAVCAFGGAMPSDGFCPRLKPAKGGQNQCQVVKFTRLDDDILVVDIAFCVQLYPEPSVRIVGH